MVQSDQLTKRIPNNSPNNTEIGQQDDEDTEPDNNTHKRPGKVCVPADTNKKELMKQRQAQILKNKQEKERAEAQALEDRDKIDKQVNPNQRDLQHLKLIVRISMILTAPDHRSLRVKHPILIKSRVQKRVKENLE